MDVDVALEVAERRGVSLWCYGVWRLIGTEFILSSDEEQFLWKWYCPRRSDHALHFRKDGEEWVLSSETVVT
jgi:hypothetical protein